MITRLSDPVSGLEIWRRFLELWEPVNRGRYRAMLMLLLQCLLMGSRGQASEWCECSVRQYEAQNADAPWDTTKAAILAHNPQDSVWCRYVRLSATRLQEYDALQSMWKEKGKSKRKSKYKGKRKGKGKGKSKRKGKEEGKRKGKEKGKSKDKAKEGISDKSNTKCTFCE